MTKDNTRHTRIRSVRFKDGGADLRIIHNDDPSPFVSAARRVEVGLRAPIMGYSIVVWDEKGAYTTLSRNWRGSPYHKVQIPGLVCDVLRREAYKNDVVEMLNGPDEPDEAG